MTGVELDMRQFSEGVKAMERAGADMRPVWKALRPLVKQDVSEHFAKREGPDGGWPGYAASTLARIRASKGMIRKRGKLRGQLTRRGEKRVGNMLGRLKSAWVFRTRGDEFVMTSRVPWSDAHQRGNGALPERPFAWVTQAIVDTATELMLARVHGAW